MRIGLYGGSFDPIHRGHVEPVLAAVDALDLDRVLYLPTAVPPHKSARVAPASARFVMVELALLGHESLWVSDLEMRPEPSYTVETVERFRRERPDDEPVLLVGADSFLGLPSWRRWRDLVTACEIGVLTRPGESLEERAASVPELVDALRQGHARVVANPPVAASSTAVRAALASASFGRSAAVLGESLEPAVLDYIRKYGLYARP